MWQLTVIGGAPMLPLYNSTTEVQVQHKWALEIRVVILRATGLGYV